MNIKEVEELIKKDLEYWVNSGDTEEAHVVADELLVELLNHLGYTEVTEIYKKVPKWYS